MGDKFLGGVSMIGPTALASVVGGLAVNIAAPLSPMHASARASYRISDPWSDHMRR